MSPNQLPPNSEERRRITAEVAAYRGADDLLNTYGTPNTPGRGATGTLLQCEVPVDVETASLLFTHRSDVFIGGGPVTLRLELFRPNVDEIRGSDQKIVFGFEATAKDQESEKAWVTSFDLQTEQPSKMQEQVIESRQVPINHPQRVPLQKLTVALHLIVRLQDELPGGKVKITTEEQMGT